MPDRNFEAEDVDASIRRSPLDPSHYVEHVTRTAMLLEHLARDVRTLRGQMEGQVEGSLRSIDILKSTVSDLQRDHAVFKVAMTAQIEINKESIETITEKLKWLNRLIIAALVTGVISGIVMLIFSGISP